MELAKELEMGLSLSELLPARVFIPMVSNCSSIMGLNVHGNGAMARVEESASSLNRLGSEVFSGPLRCFFLYICPDICAYFSYIFMAKVVLHCIQHKLYIINI